MATSYNNGTIVPPIVSNYYGPIQSTIIINYNVPNYIAIHKKKTKYIFFINLTLYKCDTSILFVNV